MNWIIGILKAPLFNNWLAVNAGPDVRFNPFGLVGLYQRMTTVVVYELPKWDTVEYGTFTYWDGPRQYVIYGKRSKPKPYEVSQIVHKDGQEGDWNGHDERRGKVSMERSGHRIDHGLDEVMPDGRTRYTLIWGMASKNKTEDRPMELGE